MKPDEIKDSKKRPEIVYHYCDVYGFSGIVQSSSIWLTDGFSTNDYSEVRLGINIVSQVIDFICRKFGDPFANHVRLVWTEYQRIHPFIAAFCSRGDVLGQWRSYADSTRGFCIGINSRSFDAPLTYPAYTASQFQRDALGFGPVDYLPDPRVNPDEFRKTLVHEVENWTLTIPSSEEEASLSASLLVARLVALSTFVKNDHFRDEDEWRLVYTPLFGAEPLDLGRIQVIGPLRQPKFRIVRQRLISYFECKLRIDVGLFISSVILGPENPNSEADVKFFLSCHGLGAVPVVRSTIPFRN